jgi:hypothetical protein
MIAIAKDKYAYLHISGVFSEFNEIAFHICIANHRKNVESA